MRPTKFDLGELLKVGLSPIDGTQPGFAVLKNLKSDGTRLVSCTEDSVTKLSSCIPFTRGIADYYITTAGIYKSSSGTPLKVHTFVGAIKVLNLIKVVYIQDSVSTFFIDSSGIYNVNPSGAFIPLCNSIVQMNGQLIAAGIRDSFNNLDEGYVLWSTIGQDCFELSKENTAGFYNPNIGKALGLIPLQDNIIILGSRGAAQMYYAAHIFGFRDIDIPLLKNPSLFAYSTNIGMYIAKDGSIIKVDKSGNFSNLNFSWIGKDVVDIRYLNGRNWFVLTTADNSFIIDENGMFSFGYKIWGEFTESLVVENSFEQTTCEFLTNFMDFHRAGLKHLHEISVSEKATAAGVVIAYSEGISKTQGYKSLNSLSSVKYPIAGHRLAIGYKSTGSSATIDRLQVEISSFDRRFGFGKIFYGGNKDAN